MMTMRKSMLFRCFFASVSLLLSCNLILAQVVGEMPQITKIKLVQVQEVGDPGVRMTKNDGFLGPAEGINCRVDLYGKDGELIVWKSLPQPVKNAIMNDLKCTAYNPPGEQVLITGGNIPIDPNHEDGMYVSTATGAGQGAARLEVTSTSYPKIKGEKLVSTGNTKTIGSANTVAPAEQPDMFLPILLGVGVAGVAVAAVAAGGMIAEEWYIDTPSGYRRMGGAATLGPYSSHSEAQSVNNEYFYGRGRVYQKDAMKSVSESSAVKTDWLILKHGRSIPVKWLEDRK